jgi:hypothetical protein
MSIQLFPENIRRFVGELTIGEPFGTAGGRDSAQFEYVDPFFPAEKSYQAFMDFSRGGRKGVDMCSTVFQKTVG